jgi:hypothetical protein
MMLNDSEDEGLLCEDDKEESLTKEVKIEMEPAGIFRVPLVWMMSDSCIDVYILTQEEDKHEDE